LSTLRTSDAVRTVVAHPRRLGELLRLLEDKDRGVRGRAAAALARLAESHPARLQRAILPLREGLGDESAYVRWHLVYAFGKIGSCFPAQSREFLGDLVSRMDDENRVVRTLACKSLTQVASRKPALIEEFFQTLKREVPPALARLLRSSKSAKRK
jgi:HEAT repeat protein